VARPCAVQERQSIPAPARSLARSWVSRFLNPRNGTLLAWLWREMIGRRASGGRAGLSMALDT